MPVNEELKKQYNAFCEAWGLHPEEYDDREKVEVMKCYYLNSLLMILVNPPKVMTIDPRIIQPVA